MNKILNWTLGACFRTLGRFLAIFLVGLLFIFIGSKIGIELPDWLSLRVNAAQSDTWDENIENNLDFYLMYNLTSNGYTNLDLNSSPFPKPDGSELTSFVNASPITLANNGIMHTFGINQRFKTGYLYSITYYQCASKRIYYLNTLVDLFIGGNSGQVASRPTNTISFQQSNITELSSEETYCSMITSLVVPNAEGSWLGIRLRGNDTTISSFYIRSYGYNIKELGIYSGTIEDSIKNSGFATAESVEEVQQSVNQVQQEIQQTQDTITNEDTTGAEDSASGFFNDFTTETFGLTSIITAPLNAINSLISSTCSPLVLPLPYVEKNLSLPCMSVIYNQYFGAFFSIYQLITTGLISYYVIVRIFNLVKDFKNPDHDEIEVVDL